jgi:hypothetical protein
MKFFVIDNAIWIRFQDAKQRQVRFPRWRRLWRWIFG